MNITWITLVVNALITLLCVGGVGWIFTIREDKKAKTLENKAKEQEIEDHKKDEVIKDWKEIAEERRARCEELKLEIEKKDGKIWEKDNTISELKAKLDDRNTYCAVAELLKCSKVQCESRIPPFASTIITTDAAIQDYVNKFVDNDVK